MHICNMWSCYYVAILILVQKNTDVVCVLAICGKNIVWQEYCVAVLVQRKRDALHLTPCHHLPSCCNQLRHLLSLQQRRALHILIEKFTLTIIYENNFACI